MVPQELTQPLSGMRALDLSGRIGAYCSKILADLGADVIKVELPTGARCVLCRHFCEGGRGPESSLLFAYYHHNKRGITLDWERSEAHPLLGELASTAHVVLASPKGERTGLPASSMTLRRCRGCPATCLRVSSRRSGSLVRIAGGERPRSRPLP